MNTIMVVKITTTAEIATMQEAGATIITTGVPGIFSRAAITGTAMNTMAKEDVTPLQVGQIRAADAKENTNTKKIRTQNKNAPFQGRSYCKKVILYPSI